MLFVVVAVCYLLLRVVVRWLLSCGVLCGNCLVFVVWCLRLVFLLCVGNLTFVVCCCLRCVVLVCSACCLLFVVCCLSLVVCGVLAAV